MTRNTRPYADSPSTLRYLAFDWPERHVQAGWFLDKHSKRYADKHSEWCADTEVTGMPDRQSS